MQKYLQGVVNGVESEGPQSTDGSRDALPETNVVRLEDWIGPCDELVPFGRRRRSATADAVPSVDPRSDAPPSAADFWGERAAAIHDALEAPDDDRASATAPVAASTHRTRGHALVAAAACLVVLLSAGLAVALNLAAGATSTPGAREPKVLLASVVVRRLSRMLTAELARIESGTNHGSRLLAARSTRVRPTTSHPHSVSEPVHYRSPAQNPTPTSAHTPNTASTERVAPPSPSPTTTTDTDSTPAGSSAPASSSTPTSSSAAVEPTGQSGALGPVSSPNG
ncbi:MAG TPA: hypothetical protein VED43_13200 [Mycobacterium sp.]|nr:hypothetical protein [Mycobacterium sp.]